MDNIARTITQSSNKGQVIFSTKDLSYASKQLPLDEVTAKQCNFNKVGGQATGTYTVFYSLTDMPKEFQKAIDKTLHNLTNTFSFLEDIIIVTGGGIENHKNHLFNCLNRLNDENLAIIIDNCHFANDKNNMVRISSNRKRTKSYRLKDTGNIKTEATHDAQTN